MPIYTVTSAAVKKALPAKGERGPLNVVAVDLRDQDGKELAAEWATKTTTPLPQPGDTLDGTVELTDFGWKFKKTPSANFNGGGSRPRDPKESAAIVRQHSQGMALKAIELGMTIGVIQAPKDSEQFRGMIRKWSEWLDQDVRDARDAA